MGRTSDDEEEFLRLLDAYLAAPADPNPRMAGVRIEWIEDNEAVGVLHMQRKHGVTREEVEQVLMEIPPFVEAKRSLSHPDRTLFWGTTRRDRWLFVVCEDRREGNKRILTPLTAYEPDEGEAYWRSQ